MVGVVGSSPIAPTSFSPGISSLTRSLGSYGMNWGSTGKRSTGKRSTGEPLRLIAADRGPILLVLPSVARHAAITAHCSFEQTAFAALVIAGIHPRSRHVAAGSSGAADCGLPSAWSGRGPHLRQNHFSARHQIADGVGDGFVPEVEDDVSTWRLDSKLRRPRWSRRRTGDRRSARRDGPRCAWTSRAWSWPCWPGLQPPREAAHAVDVICARVREQMGATRPPRAPRELSRRTSRRSSLPCSSDKPARRA